MNPPPLSTIPQIHTGYMKTTPRTIGINANHYACEPSDISPRFHRSTVPKIYTALKGNPPNAQENRNKLALSAVGHKAPTSTVPQIHSDIEKTTLITIGKTTNH